MTTKKTEARWGDDKKAWAITHVAFEDLGSFGQILREAGFTVEYLDAATGDLDQVRPEDDDLLIVLGGPISVNEVDDYPFLKTELDFETGHSDVVSRAGGQADAGHVPRCPADRAGTGRRGHSRRAQGNRLGADSSERCRQPVRIATSRW